MGGMMSQFFGNRVEITDRKGDALPLAEKCGSSSRKTSLSETRRQNRISAKRIRLPIE